MVYIRWAQKIRKFDQQVVKIHDQLNGPFGNRIVSDKVSSN